MKCTPSPPPSEKKKEKTSRQQHQQQQTATMTAFVKGLSQTDNERKTISLQQQTTLVPFSTRHWPGGKASTARPPRWPSGYGVRLESERSRVRIPLAPGFLRGRVIPVAEKLALQWLPCQAPGVIGSVLGLVGPVSVYCD